MLLACSSKDVKTSLNRGNDSDAGRVFNVHIVGSFKLFLVLFLVALILLVLAFLLAVLLQMVLVLLLAVVLLVGVVAELFQPLAPRAGRSCLASLRRPDAALGALSVNVSKGTATRNNLARSR